LYKGKCRECLAVLVDLPNKGFHHACRSLIISNVKPERSSEATKRKAEFDPGTPSDPNMAVYIRSESINKRQKLVELLKEKQLKRKAAEMIEASAKAQADQDAADLAEFEALVKDDMVEEPELTEDEREAQDRAIANMPDSDMDGVADDV
jgi:hypothetical protein